MIPDARKLLAKNILGRLMVIRVGFKIEDKRFSAFQTTYIRVLAKVTANYQAARLDYLQSLETPEIFNYFSIANKLEDLISDLKRLGEIYNCIKYVGIFTKQSRLSRKLLEAKAKMESRAILDMRNSIQHIASDIFNHSLKNNLAPFFTADGDLIKYSTYELKINDIYKLINTHYAIADELLEIVAKDNQKN